MLTATGRSAAAKKASETRKRNKYEAMHDEVIQSARRQHLTTDEQWAAFMAYAPMFLRPVEVTL
jgi:hypothetical protein